jgi:small subunit ribosomal protein S14
MAKKNFIERQKKQIKCINKFLQKRYNLFKEQLNATTIDQQLLISKKIQTLPRNSSPIRLRNRCWKTGRPRAFYRFFGLSRNILREFGQNGLLPGLIKSSW